MAYISKWRFAKISPRKARLLTDLIRGKTVAEAMDLLKFSKKRGAVMVGKVLKSAVANADEREADVEDLYVVGSNLPYTFALSVTVLAAASVETAAPAAGAFFRALPCFLRAAFKAFLAANRLSAPSSTATVMWQVRLKMA